MKDLATGLLGYLICCHTGQEKAVPSRALEARFSVHGATIRRAVLRLRRERHPICSGPSGYYYAASRPELLETVLLFHARLAGASSVKKALNGAMARMSDFGQASLYPGEGGDV